jgi:hypothetical protein
MLDNVSSLHSGDATEHPSVASSEIVTNEPLVPERKAADWLGLSVKTLQSWRCNRAGRRREGPPFVRVGRAIRYRPSDIEAFIRANVVAPEERVR